MGGCSSHTCDFYKFLFQLITTEGTNELYASIQVIDLCKLQPLLSGSFDSIPLILENSGSGLRGWLLYIYEVMKLVGYINKNCH